ncbi:40S ribosomal protein S23 [Platysternon megacephalum]|uniref:40S ribosomal protein S23 n=1 Tax=Platysternon megacephalum TaxID=55544 RepID=A0A4D9DJ01_9SAUR|nr:40S ribosomal protein S23 [Platysternon megacephalum]
MMSPGLVYAHTEGVSSYAWKELCADPLLSLMVVVRSSCNSVLVVFHVPHAVADPHLTKPSAIPDHCTQMHDQHSVRQPWSVDAAGRAAAIPPAFLGKAKLSSEA